MKPSNVVGLMLAAGQSKRFGADKRQAKLPCGQPLLAASVNAAAEQLTELWLVLRGDDDASRLQLPPDIKTVFSAASIGGMGHSLADGVTALMQTSDADAVAILLGDMPWIHPSTFRHLLAQADPQRIIVPTFNGEPGHPVIFGRAFWPQLVQLSGDSGAKAVLQANAKVLRRVAVEDAGILRDVDTPQALMTP